MNMNTCKCCEWVSWSWKACWTAGSRIAFWGIQLIFFPISYIISYVHYIRNPYPFPFHNPDPFHENESCSLWRVWSFIFFVGLHFPLDSPLRHIRRSPSAPLDRFCSGRRRPRWHLSLQVLIRSRTSNSLWYNGWRTGAWKIFYYGQTRYEFRISHFLIQFD